VRAAQFVDQHRIVIEEVPEPRVRPGAVKVRVVWSAICGSDQGLWKSPGAKPGIHGHEAAGTIVEVGEGVTRRQVGEEVLVYDVIGCGTCGYCQRREYTRCSHRQGGVGGGFGQYLVAPESNVLPIAPGIGLERGCVLSDCLCTPLKAVESAQVLADEWVVVFGGGPIGLNAVQCVRAMGGRPLHIEPLAYRREAGVRVGAQASLDPTEGDLGARIREITGPEGAPCVVECTGVPEAQRATFGAVAPGGRIVFVGENASGLSINVSEDLIRRDIRVQGSWYFFPSHVELASTLFAQGRLDPLAVVSHRVTLETIADGFRMFCDRSDGCTKVIVRMDGE